jgi:methionyl-tRNA synthetase
VTTLVEKYLDGQIVFEPLSHDNEESKAIDSLIQEFHFHEALSKIWEWVAWANKTVDEQKLWELGKSNPEKFTETSKQLLASIRAIAEKLQPFTPETSRKILEHLSKEKITKIDQLFPRIE